MNIKISNSSHHKLPDEDECEQVPDQTYFNYLTDSLRSVKNDQYIKKQAAVLKVVIKNDFVLCVRK